jgi:hypothetical protein
MSGISDIDRGIDLTFRKLVLSPLYKLYENSSYFYSSDWSRAALINNRRMTPKSMGGLSFLAEASF